MRKRQQQQTIPILILVAGGLLLVIAAVILLAQNNARKNTVQPSTAANNQEATYAEIERVSLADAKTAFDSGNAVFLDVRGVEVYAASHIPGALSIPLAELETRQTELDPDQWIITYCT